MSSSDIHIFDLKRILVGEVPGVFFIEVLIRLVITYLLALAAMRFMGKRMATQLSRNELSALVSLSAAIGVSIQAPDRGLLPSFVIVVVIILVGRFVAHRASKSRKFETLSQGKTAVLVKNGELHTKAMRETRISRERILAQLRAFEVKHLGEVERLYIEAGGNFSLLKKRRPGPGLSVVPDWDKELRREQKKDTAEQACHYCGRLQKNTGTACTNCGKKEWVPAVAGS